jgi:predicted metal-binding membrane protein
VNTAAAVEGVVRRERLVTGLALAITVVVAWAYLVRDAAEMQAMAGEARMHAAMGMADPRVWGFRAWLGLFAMWAVMMAAMMLPSAAPVEMLVLGVYRRRNTQQARTATLAFILGYLAVWTGFSLAASIIQLVLHRAALVGADMRLASNAVSGLLFLAVGIYQWLPIKRACLTHCQSPLGFLTQHWREGARGGVEMGLRHGAFCLGCCWLLMMPLFVVGTMNLIWVAMLTALVLVEKLARRRGALVGRLAGVAMAVWGAYALFESAGPSRILTP